MHEFLDYARRGRNDWWRYLATPMLSFALVFMVDLIVSPWITVTGLSPKAYHALADDPSQVAWYYGSGSLFGGVLLLGLVVSALIVHHKKFNDIVGCWRWSQVALGAGAGLIVFVVAGGVDYIVQPGGFRLSSGPQTAILFLLAVPFALLLNLWGQVFFCGYLTQGVLLATKRPLVTAVVIGVLSLYGAENWPHAVGGFATMVLEVMITIRTGSIAFAWGFGVVGDFLGAILVVDSESPLRGSPGLFTQTTPGLAWFDVAVSCLLLVIFWLWFVRRYPLKEQAADVFA